MGLKLHNKAVEALFSRKEGSFFEQPCSSQCEPSVVATKLKQGVSKDCLPGMRKGNGGKSDDECSAGSSGNRMDRLSGLPWNWHLS